MQTQFATFFKCHLVEFTPYQILGDSKDQRVLLKTKYFEFMSFFLDLFELLRKDKEFTYEQNEKHPTHIESIVESNDQTCVFALMQERSDC